MKALTFMHRSACRIPRFAHLNRELSLNASSKSTTFLIQNQIVPKIDTIVRRNMSSGPIYTVDYLTDKIKKELQAEHVDMEDLSNCGCGMKFDAVIVSPKFEGKPILQRQRLVNQTLAEEMKHIHAFTMRTLTPSQWKDSLEKEKHNNVS